MPSLWMGKNTWKGDVKSELKSDLGSQAPGPPHAPVLLDPGRYRLNMSGSKMRSDGAGREHLMSQEARTLLRLNVGSEEVPVLL